MTRKLLLTAAIVALALAPSIGTGTAQARGFYGGGYGRGFYGGYGRGFYGGYGRGFYVDSGPAFTAGSAASIWAITAMAISRTAITVTDRLQLAP